MLKYIALMLVAVSAVKLRAKGETDDIISLLDNDGSNTISEKEFKDFIETAFNDAGVELDDANWSIYKNEFDRADKDGSGDVSKEELENYLKDGALQMAQHPRRR